MAGIRVKDYFNSRGIAAGHYAGLFLNFPLLFYLLFY